MNVDRTQINSISLFAGVGGLDLGVAGGLEYLGIAHRTACYVEREAFAASQLVTLMEAGCLDAAPVWSDVTTFPARQFRGVVDLVFGGFPCQDISIAGRQRGLDGARSGLFFNILDIADDCDASILFLENVAAITSAGATVMDETEGELTERAASRIMGELADRGWDAEWLHVSASDVGASHKRERWFCLAIRAGRGLGELREPSGSSGFADRGKSIMANPDGTEQHQEREGNESGGEQPGRRRPAIAAWAGATGADVELADSKCRTGSAEQLNDARERQSSKQGNGPVFSNASAHMHNELANPESRRGGFRLGDEQPGRSEAESAGDAMGNTENPNRRRELETRGTRIRRTGLAGNGIDMAIPSSPRREGSELSGTRNSDRGGAGSTWTN